VTFYDSCSSYIALQSGPELATSLAALATTCENSLPTEQLLLAAAGCTHSRIFALGGFGSDSTPTSVESFDLVTGNWSYERPMSEARTYFAGVIANDQLYALGGRDTSYSTLASVEALNLLTGTWTAVAPMGTARCGHGAVLSNERIYAIGGSMAGLYLDSGTTIIFSLNEVELSTWNS
jgi:hypothetical protein